MTGRLYRAPPPAGNWRRMSSQVLAAWLSDASGSVGKYIYSELRLDGEQAPGELSRAGPDWYPRCSHRQQQELKHGLTASMVYVVYTPTRCLAQNKMFDGAETAAENFLARGKPAGSMEKLLFIWHLAVCISSASCGPPSVCRSYKMIIETAQYSRLFSSVLLMVVSA